MERSVSESSRIAIRSRCRIDSSCTLWPTVSRNRRWSVLTETPTASAMAVTESFSEPSPRINCTAAVTSSSSVASVSVLARTLTPSGGTMMCRRLPASRSFRMASIILAASSPSRPVAVTMLERGGRASEQKTSSLSTPRIATSAGTASPASRQAVETSQAYESLAASTPMGRGNVSSHFTSRSARRLANSCVRRCRENSYTCTGMFASVAAAVNTSRRCHAQTRSVGPQNAKCRNPSARRCSKASLAMAASSTCAWCTPGAGGNALSTSTTGTRSRETAFATRSEWRRAITPSPRHFASHAGGLPSSRCVSWSTSQSQPCSRRNAATP